MSMHLRDGVRPRVWTELLLIGIGYWAYSLIRNAVPARAGAAFAHAGDVLRIEGDLGLDVEQHVNHTVNASTWVIVAMNYFYSVLWVVATIGVLVWLYVRHPDRYRAARTTLFATTMLALAGFFLFPLAPPRLMPGYIDTTVVHHTWGSFASGGMASLSNQYAAMPSMHIGWSLWAGIAVYLYAQRRWVRILGLLYPLATLAVVVSTGNHYLLDAVGGAVTLALGYGVQRLLPGFTPIRTPAQRPALSTRRM